MGSRLPHGPEFTHFLSLEDKPKKRRDLLKSEPHPYVDKETLSGDGRKGIVSQVRKVHSPYCLLLLRSVFRGAWMSDELQRC